MRLRYICLVAILITGARGAPIDGTFSYQGRLTDGGTPVTGSIDVLCSLWDAGAGGTQIAPSVTKLAVPVNDGLFSFDLGFQIYAFDGNERWLQIQVRNPAGSGSYVNLGRQQIFGTPYAIQTRGIDVKDNLDVHMGTSGPGRFLRFENGTDEVVLLGASSADDAGRIELRSGADPSINMVVIDADADDDGSNGQEIGVIKLRSRGLFGPGGRLSLQNNNGTETVRLDGGSSADGSGSINMLTPLGVQYAGLEANSDGGYFFLADSTIGYPFFGASADSFGGGRLSVSRRANGANGFVVDGNYAGTESTSVKILGTDAMITFRTDTTGGQTVELPADAISSSEISNESGVASNSSNTPFNLSGGVQNVISRTITCPNTGYCVVIASAQLNLYHSNGTLSQMRMGVSDVSGVIPATQDSVFTVPVGETTDAHQIPATVHGVFSVSPGAHTFYLVSEEVSGAAGMSNPQITVLYVPTAYGTVTSTLLARGGVLGDGPARTAPLTAGELEAERVGSIMADQARRDAEWADMQAQMRAMRAEIDELKQERAGARRPADRTSNSIGAGVLGINGENH